jgi:hypothetical protein
VRPSGSSGCPDAPAVAATSRSVRPAELSPSAPRPVPCGAVLGVVRRSPFGRLASGRSLRVAPSGPALGLLLLRPAGQHDQRPLCTSPELSVRAFYGHNLRLSFQSSRGITFHDEASFTNLLISVSEDRDA